MPEPILITGGPIRTMVDEDSPPAVLVQDGRIVALGSPAECRRVASATPRVIDLEGRTLFPAFIDPHVHTLLLGAAQDWVDLSGCRTVHDILSALRDYATQHPDAPAIYGYGYDQSKLREGRHPFAAELDRVDANRPVLIQHASGHGYVVNSVVLQASSIGRSTPTPPGGWIGRDPSGQPTGPVFDAACDLLTGPDGVKIRNHGPNFHLPMPETETSRLFDLGQRALLAAGITTVCDAQVTELEMATYLAARDEGRLRIRASLLVLSSHLDHLVGLGLRSWIGDERLSLRGVKLYADGSVIARTALLPCDGTSCAPPFEGYLYHDADELTRLIGTAHRLGLPTATHAQGPVPIGMVLDAVHEARRRWPRDRLVHRIEHCGFPSDEHLMRMSELAVVPVPQPMQVHLYADALIRDFEFGGELYPCGLFARHGIPVVISSDAPVTPPGPLKAAWAAITRRTAEGAEAGGVDLRIPRDAALRGVTTTAAVLLERPDVGRIRVGARADLVFLDRDPATIPVDEFPEVQVIETWVDGQPAWTRERTGS